MVDTFLDMAADSLVPVLSGTHSSNTRIPNKFHLKVKYIKQSLTWRTGSEEIDKKKLEK